MILAINSASEQVSIALLENDKIKEEVSWKSYRTQSKEILPKIDQILAVNKIKLSDITAVAVYQGPGSYTGLRVGISIANTLGSCLNIPVIGIKFSKAIRQSNKKSSKNIFQPQDCVSALTVAARAENILKKKKITKFTDFISPYYSSKI